MKRIVLICTALALLLSCLSACSKEGSTDQQTTQPTIVEDENGSPTQHPQSTEATAATEIAEVPPTTQTPPTAVIPPVTEVLPTTESPNTPEQPAVLAVYDSSQDAAFLPKDIFDSSLYVNGLIPTKDGSKYFIDVKGQADSSRAIVIKCEYGKCYEIKCPADMSALRIAMVSSDPRNANVGETINYSSSGSLKYYDNKPDAGEAVSLMYVARAKNTYLVLYTGTDTPTIQILERTIIQSTDTSGPWFTAPQIGGANGGEGSFGDYHWTSDEVYAKLYEPYRAKYPDYISREHLGRDQSGKYDMYAYIYEPESYKTCMFLNSGTHADEYSAYMAFAAFLQLVCDATEDGDPLLWFMRNNVKMIVVPMTNVWSVSEAHKRQNSTNTDLNRDWANLTQQETKNIYEFFKKCKDEVDIVMDFHNCTDKYRSLYFNFINYTDNAVANYKTTNHMYHLLQKHGYIKETPDITHIPGSYVKSNQYFEGRIWNEFNVPTITVEHANLYPSDPNFCGSAEVTLATEIFGNFIIQNALFFAQDN